MSYALFSKMVSTNGFWRARSIVNDPLHAVNQINRQAGISLDNSAAKTVAALAGMTRREALFTFTTMVMARRFSNRCFELQRQGHENGGIRFAITGHGHEGFEAPLGLLLNSYQSLCEERQNRDIGAYYYRGQTALIAHGVSLMDLMKLTYSLPEDMTGGSQMPVMWGDMALGIMPITADVGSHVPPAVGMAKARTFLHEPGITIATIGDGTFRAAPVATAIQEALTRELPRDLKIAVTLAGNPERPEGMTDDKFAAYLAGPSEIFEAAKARVTKALSQAVPELLKERREYGAAISAIFHAKSPDEFETKALPAIHAAYPPQTPFILAVEDNDYGISVPKSGITPLGKSVGPIPEGYLVIEIDGSDVVASWKAWKKAFDHTRSGQGPVVIWAHVPRFGSHSTSDDASLYRPEAATFRAKQNDPVVKWTQKLIALGIVGESDVIAIEKAIDEDLAAAVAYCRQAPNRFVPFDEAGKWLPAEAKIQADFDGHHFPSIPYRPDPQALILPQTSENASPITMVSGVNRVLLEQLAYAMENPDALRTVFFGEDVGDGILSVINQAGLSQAAERKLKAIFGGVFRYTQGLETAAPDGWVFNTAIEEGLIAALAIGYALTGKVLAVPEIQFRDYASPALQQMNDLMATMAARTGGRVRLPIILRMHSGGYLQGAGGYGHSESAAGPLAHYPGWYVVAPSTPLDAIGLYRSAFRMLQAGHHVPTIMLDPKASRNLKAPFFPENYEVPIGKAEIMSTGSGTSPDRSDIMLYSWGNTLHHARVVKAILEKDEAALHRLRHEEPAAGTMPMFVFGEHDSEFNKALWLMQGKPAFSVGLVNVRTLVPVDRETLSTGLRFSRGIGLVIGEDRRLGGIDASIADQLIEANLDLEPVVHAYGAQHGRVPYGPYNEPHNLPQLPGMVQAALNLID